MTPEERAAKVMRECYGRAEFDPQAYQSIERTMATAIREAVAAERGRCQAAVRSLAAVSRLHPWKAEEIARALEPAK